MFFNGVGVKPAFVTHNLSSYYFHSLDFLSFTPNARILLLSTFNSFAEIIVKSFSPLRLNVLWEMFAAFDVVLKSILTQHQGNTIELDENLSKSHNLSNCGRKHDAYLNI